MDTAKEMWKMIMGNLALIQVADPLKMEMLFTYCLTIITSAAAEQIWDYYYYYYVWTVFFPLDIIQCKMSCPTSVTLGTVEIWTWQAEMDLFVFVNIGEFEEGEIPDRLEWHCCSYHRFRPLWSASSPPSPLSFLAGSQRANSRQVTLFCSARAA